MDGDVIANLPANTYTLMVEANATRDVNQFSSDTVGPITLTGGTGACKCNS